MKAVGEALFELGRKQVQLFVTNKLSYCEILVTCSCPRQILFLAYETLVRQHKVGAIEDMLLQDKESVWALAKGLAQGRLGKRSLIELVKALIAMEYFLNC